MHRVASHVVNSSLMRSASSRNTSVLLLVRHLAKAADKPHLQVYDGGEKPLVLSKEKVKRDPFVKNLFIGKFDKQMLIYPEVLDEARLSELESMASSVQKFLDDKVDTREIDREKKIPDEVLEGFKSLGLFGQQIPTEYGGLGLTATEYARMCEVTGVDGAIAVTLAAHNSIGIKGILLCGNEEQKRKYFPKLATGEHVAAFCLTESTSGSDAASIKCQAKLSSDKKHFILNGSKIYISNGGFADVMTVFAKVPIDTPDRQKKEVVTAFIVERDFGGVTSGPPEDKLGIRGANTTALYFDNTPVPCENVLGAVGDGFKVAMNVLNNGRFGMGAAISGGLRKLIRETTDHVINRVQFEKPLSEFHMIKEKITRMASTLYAIESMVYTSSAILDVVEDPDCALECAIVKVFSSEAAMQTVSECLQIHGGSGYMKGLSLEQFYRDTRILPIFEGTNEILRLFISLVGVQYAGKHLGDVVKKLRDPLSNPIFVIRKLWERRKDDYDSPVLDLDLCSSVHPSLKSEADRLEYCVKRLKYAVETSLQRYGHEIVEYQVILARIADIAIDVYAYSCALSRASRSYCIGLRNASHELDLVNCLGYDLTQRVKANMSEIDNYIETGVMTKKLKVADQVFKDKMYFAAHPLTRNW
ncbi:complex I assembly factor ACAD9, mitochondrial-like [Ornithodoros turicata]